MTDRDVSGEATEDLGGLLEALRGTVVAHHEIGKGIAEVRAKSSVRGEHRTFLHIIQSEYDIIMFGTMDRSLSLIDGFVAMVERRNSACAWALTRLQLDNLLRLYACTLARSVKDVYDAMRSDTPLRKVRDRHNKLMTDGYLADSLSQAFGHPGIKGLYDYLSGFVHLSGKHLMGGDIDFGRSLGVTYTWRPAGREMEQEEAIVLLHNFQDVTDLLIMFARCGLERLRAEAN